MQRLLVLLVAGAVSGVCAAQDAQPEMSPEAAAMMEAYVAAGKPGVHHLKLVALVGDWKITNSSWMEPGGEPIVSEGKARKAWDLDKRFLREEISGVSPMGDYHGVGYLGYDNATEQYQGVWMSSMATGMILYTGQLSADGKTLTCTGQEADPASGAMLDFEMTIEIESMDKHTLTFWYLMPGDQKLKAFEMVHERQR